MILGRSIVIALERNSREGVRWWVWAMVGAFALTFTVGLLARTVREFFEVSLPTSGAWLATGLITAVGVASLTILGQLIAGPFAGKTLETSRIRQERGVIRRLLTAAAGAWSSRMCELFLLELNPMTGVVVGYQRASIASSLPGAQSRLMTSMATTSAGATATRWSRRCRPTTPWSWPTSGCRPRWSSGATW